MAKLVPLLISLHFTDTVQELTQHPLGQCYPPLNADELAKLEESIIKDGPSPVMLFEDKVLDGWHQYKVCKKLGVTPILESPKIDNPVLYVIRRNDGRRHMSTKEKLIVAEKLSNLENGSNQYQKKVGTSCEVPTSVAKISKALGVPESTVGKVRHARRHGIPEVTKAFEEEKIGPTTAYELSRLPKEKQAEALPAAIKRESRTTSGLPSGRKKSRNKAPSPFETPEFKNMEAAALAVINAPSLYPEDAELPVHPSGEINTKFIQESIIELRKNEPNIGKMPVREMFQRTIWPYTQAIQTYALNPPPSNALCGDIDQRLVLWARTVACKVRERQLLLFKRNEIRKRIRGTKDAPQTEFKSNGKHKSKDSIEVFLKTLKKLLKQSHFALDDRELVTQKTQEVVTTYFEERWKAYTGKR
jgi:hypothetical protein